VIPESSAPRLRTFGRVQLEGVDSLGPQQLLLLTYVALEGPQTRAELAVLFWPHLAGEVTRKGERKHLSNLGVALAVLRRDAGVDVEHPDGLTCDARLFETHLLNAQLEAAVTLHERGRFLDGIEHKPRLRLGQELLQWITARRERFDHDALTALVTLAERACAAKQLEVARAHAECACRIAFTDDPPLLSRLRRVLNDLGSPLAGRVDEAMGASFVELRTMLSPEALRLYLTLSLLEPPNLAAAGRASELSARVASSCLEELRLARVALPDGAWLTEPARRHLDEHPALKMTLLGALRDFTPTEQAFSIYRDIFELSHSFGGLGYWERARTAYVHHATALIRAQNFQGAAEALAQFQHAEYLNQQVPHPESRFLHAYALERLRRFKQGLEVLEGVAFTPDVLAIRSALLVHTGDYASARAAAEGVIHDASAGAWAKAIALNTAGQIDCEPNRLHEADVHFDQAGVMWALAEHPQREAGALVNRANVLERLGRIEDARRIYEAALRRAENNHVLRTRTLLNLGYMYERLEGWDRALAFYEQARSALETSDLEATDGALAASVHNNLGYAQWKVGRLEAARASIERALHLAQVAGDRRFYGLALGNMALIERRVGKLELALEIFRQLGNERDYDEHAALYVQLLESLLLEAMRETQPSGARFYLEKLLGHFERHDQPDLATQTRTRFGALLETPSSDHLESARTP
jgi:tetratricopeptide (TPR) repeat protein